jgi:hypothetical protein
MFLVIALSHLFLSFRPEASVSVQVSKKSGGDPTPPRFFKTQREPIRPPLSRGINAVPGDSSDVPHVIKIPKTRGIS